MKKYPALILMLAVCLAGCAPENPAEVTEQPTILEEETVVPIPEKTIPQVTEPTEELQKQAQYPQTIEREISIEGIPETMTMELFDGGNYVIYIPEKGWVLKTEMEDGFLTDSWEYLYHDDIEVEVISCGPMPPEEAAAWILEEEEDYMFQFLEDGSYGGMDMADRMYQDIRIVSDCQNTFVLTAEYPMDAGDGFAPRTGAVLDSFLIKE